MSRLGAARRLRAVVAAAVVLLATSACAGSDQPSAAGSGDSSAAEIPDTTVVVPGVRTLAELRSGTWTAPPTSSPKPATGKKVWWIACSTATPVCLIPGEAAAEAGQTLGIDVHIADGKLNVGGGYATAVRDAVAANADGIILYGVSCDYAQQAFREAKQAGVLTLGAAANDCSETGGESLFTAPFIPSETVGNGGNEYFREMGRASAEYIINKTGGQVKLLYTAGQASEQVARDQGFREVFSTCPGCEIVSTVTYNTPDLVPNGPWIQAWRSELLKHPEATAAYLEWDVHQSVLGGAQAVVEAGRQDMITFGGEGVPDTFAMVRDGRMDALTKVHSSGWLGYAAMDEMNRAFNGEPAVPEGLGFVVTDSDHNLPAPGATFEPALDYKSMYERMWQEAAANG